MDIGVVVNQGMFGQTFGGLQCGCEAIGGHRSLVIRFGPQVAQMIPFPPSEKKVANFQSSNPMITHSVFLSPKTYSHLKENHGIKIVALLKTVSQPGFYFLSFLFLNFLGIFESKIHNWSLNFFYIL